MGIFNKKKIGGWADVIRCDEPSYLIWKWHPDGLAEGQSTRENAIRYGSSLRVKDGEVAVFVYKQKDGLMQEYIEGPYDQKIQTKNLPILAGIVGLAFESGTPFQAEIYFINLAKVIQIRFAVPYFDVFDPRFLDFAVPMAVRGTVSFKIADYREFIKLHRLTTFTLEDFQLQVRDAVSQYVRSFVANAPAEADMPVTQIERKTLLLSDRITANIGDRFMRDFGVNITAVDIGAIDIDKSSDGYRHLMSVTKDISIASIQSKTVADLEHYAESLRIQREEGQYAMHKQAQSANIGAFQIEKQVEVGVAGAQALGKMGANGAGNVNLGGATGFNPAAMMTSIAVGNAVGKNVANVMNGAMSGINNPVQTPPPVPQEAYFVAVNGQPTGPFDMQTLSNMAMVGSFAKTSFVWKQGMENWICAGDLPDLQKLFSMPPIPNM